MKITAFNPLILSPKADEIIELFEAMGFEHRHKKTGISDENVTTVDMKNQEGFRVNVAQVGSMPQDMMTIRMSVDDFDEAVEFLSARGFRSFSQSDEPTETGSSRAKLMVSPSGFSISLSQHLK